MPHNNHNSGAEECPWTQSQPWESRMSDRRMCPHSWIKFELRHNRSAGVRQLIRQAESVLKISRDLDGQ